MSAELVVALVGLAGLAVGVVAVGVLAVTAARLDERAALSRRARWSFVRGIIAGAIVAALGSALVVGAVAVAIVESLTAH